MGQVSAQEAIALLDQLIATPSHSREEKATGDLIEAFLCAQGIDVQRIQQIIDAYLLRKPVCAVFRSALMQNHGIHPFFFHSNTKNKKCNKKK